MGTGSPQEAELTLREALPAGQWTFVGDGIITRPVDVTFEIFVRRNGGAEVALATFVHHFDPLPNGRFEAQPYEQTFTAPAVPFEEGDQLIWRYSGDNTDALYAYIPNGDGELAQGRIPHLDLPE